MDNETSTGAERMAKRLAKKRELNEHLSSFNPNPTTLRNYRRAMVRKAAKSMRVKGPSGVPDPYGNRYKRRRDAVVQPKLLAIGSKALFG